jgi:hypothetical protein
MGLEVGFSPPAQLDRRTAILGGALLRRRSELQKSWKRFISAECLESLGPIAPQVVAILSGQEEARGCALPDRFIWLSSDADFWGCLQAVALARKVECRPADAVPPRLSVGELKKLSGTDRLQALCSRYRCPLNIAAASEREIAEELLRQLMVPDRAKFEAGARFDVDLVLLALNLIGIRALASHELRSFDALNYFYELPLRSLVSMRANSRLLAFWLCIYAQLVSKRDWLK